MKLFFRISIILLLAVVATNHAKADMNAQAIVNSFNGATGGTKMQFTYDLNYREVSVTKISELGFANTSAYANGVTGSSDYFRSFCIEPDIQAYPNMLAVLNYENGKSTTTEGHSLTVGAAYLYSQFAAGTLKDYSYPDSGREADSNALQEAIRYLIGAGSLSGSNVFINNMLTIKDAAFWNQIYNPNEYYEIIGNYSVFVMNCYSSPSQYEAQDFIYVANASPSTDTPEPASVLLWTLGSFGALAAARRARKNRMKHTGA